MYGHDRTLSTQEVQKNKHILIIQSNMLFPCLLTAPSLFIQQTFRGTVSEQKPCSFFSVHGDLRSLREPSVPGQGDRKMATRCIGRKQSNFQGFCMALFRSCLGIKKSGVNNICKGRQMNYFSRNKVHTYICIVGT